MPLILYSPHSQPNYQAGPGTEAWWCMVATDIYTKSKIAYPLPHNLNIRVVGKAWN